MLGGMGFFVQNKSNTGPLGGVLLQLNLKQMNNPKCNC